MVVTWNVNYRTVAVAGTGSGAVSVGIGGSGAVGGDGNSVTSITQGDITTTGKDSDALFVQTLEVAVETAE